MLRFIHRRFLPAALALGAAIFTGAPLCPKCLRGDSILYGFLSAKGQPLNESPKQTKAFGPERSAAELRLVSTQDNQARLGRRQGSSHWANTQQSSGSRTSKQNIRPGAPGPNAAPANDPKTTAEPAHYTYEFIQPQFYIHHIVIEHDANGQGKISFERLNEKSPIVEQLEISPAALARISALWQALRFLDSEISYQSSKQFPHLGTMRISMKQGLRKRTAEFNWTKNHEASALVNEYRRLADQSIFVFDMSIARQNQPLNTPKLMEQLESLLKRNWLSDWQQLVPLLKEISSDEHLPLIARNHALRLLKRIEN